MPSDEVLRDIELIVSDVDGVLTDASIVYTNDGIEIKRFNVRDGLGIKLWQRAGFHFGVLTARTSHIVKLRTAELGIEIVRQGFEDKLPVAKEILNSLEIAPERACYVGDDLPDLPVMRYFGVGFAVATAVKEVRDSATLVTEASGGDGAVREVIERVLRAKGRWQDLISKY